MSRLGVSLSTVVAPAAMVTLVTTAGAQMFQDQTAARFPSQFGYSNQCSIADVDGDGDLDIAFADGGGFFSQTAPEQAKLYINNGSGVFADQSAARLPGFTGNFRGVEFGDIDRDGDWDIVFANDFNQLPRLGLNDGNGFFTDVTAARLPNITLGSSRAQFGDLDNDGDLDIYFTNGGASRWGTGQGKIYLNDGNGFFTDATATNHPSPAAGGNVSEPQDVIFGDMDADFDLDIRIASTASNQSKLYRNNGQGQFLNASILVPPDANCYSYDFGDINGDGDIDLLGANAGSPVNTELLLDNNGLGAFTNVSNQFTPNPQGDDNDSKFFDYDNDGDMDIVIAALFQGGEKIYNNNGAGVFTQGGGLITGQNDASLDVKVADLDGDGRYDIITAQGESGSFQNRIYINTTGPIDNRPPTIVRTEEIDDDSEGPFVVRAVITDAHTSDRGFHDTGVNLNYTVDAAAGGVPQQVEMLWSGNAIWRGVIPASAACAGGDITYWVTATDFNGNLGTGAMTTFSPAAGGGGPAADLNGDCSVNAADLALLLGAWGRNPGHPADINEDGFVNAADLALLLGSWG